MRDHIETLIWATGILFVAGLFAYCVSCAYQAEKQLQEQCGENCGGSYSYQNNTCLCVVSP